MFTMQIDGRIVDATEGQSVLEVAKANGFDIPTLCYHAGLETHGGCRLCLVEVTRDSWDGWRKLVVSCEYPASAGLVVFTDSPLIQRSRRNVLDLLLARSPEAPVVRRLAREYGIAETSFQPREDADKCILCAICTRVCAAVGADAITTSGRGIDKLVGVPFGDDASACVGCLSCAQNCPTGHIEYSEDATSRTIWGRTFELARCPDCGAVLGTPEQLAHYASKGEMELDELAVCDACRKQATARAFHRVTFDGAE